MRLDPGLVAITEEAHGADGAGDNELDGQDGVDLADELVSDIDGRLGDRASKLCREIWLAIFVQLREARTMRCGDAIYSTRRRLKVVDCEEGRKWNG